MARKYLGGGKWQIIPDKKPSRSTKNKVAPKSPPKPSSGTSKNNKNRSVPKKSGNKSVPKKSGNKTSSKSKTTSKKSEPQYKELEKSILKGTVNIAVAKPKLKSKRTVSLQGLGKTLTGVYFIEKVTHKIDKDGYTQELEVSKGGMKSLKQNAKGDSSRRPSVKPKVSTKIHVMRRGDTLWDLARKHYGSGTKWGILARANNIKNPRRIPVGKRIKIPL